MYARIEMLYGKDSKENYQNLLKLEKISQKNASLYKYTNQFYSMIHDENYGIRVRGYRLLAKQAKWDEANKLNLYIDEMLNVLDDIKPTATRMKIKALYDIVVYKKELRIKIKDRINNFDCSKFNESMRPLIMKDCISLIGYINSLD